MSRPKRDLEKLKAHLLGNIDLTGLNGNEYYEKPSEGCWEWRGYVSPKGWMDISYGGKRHRVVKLAYEVLKGEIPKDHQLYRKCKNMRCINPEHQEVMTISEHNRRAHGEGEYKGVYFRSGEECPWSKMTWEGVLEARRMRLEGKTYQSIADHFQVSLGAISAILRNRSWKELEKESLKDG